MRHLSRHLQATFQDHVFGHLTMLGWASDPDRVPFAALPVKHFRKRPDEHLLESFTPNLVAVSFGSQTNDDPLELGGGIVEQEHDFFVDILAENEGVGLALAEDVRDLLVGRAAGIGRFIPLLNYVEVPPTRVPGYLVEIDDVVRAPSERVLPKAEWQVVSGTLRLVLPGVD